MKVKFKKLRENAIIPKRATEGSSGFDLCYAPDNAEGFLPTEMRGDRLTIYCGGSVVVGTGIAAEIPVGYELQVRSRSGLAAKNGVFVLNSPGTVDSDYRGEIKVILHNAGPHHFHIDPGDRIAQLVPAQLPTVVVEVVDELTETQRGAGGFGSTGVK